MKELLKDMRIDGYNGNRKDQHVFLARHQYSDDIARDFAETHFVHQSLPELHLDEVDVTTSVAGIDLPIPFFINAMTGGSEETGEINRLIGIYGFLTGFPIASGSVSAALKDPSVAKTFRVLRDENPKGVIFANLGAHHDVENAKRAVDLLEANALQIHLNAPQELVMQEGDRDFSMWLKNIEAIVKELEVPVIVKEVGFGMSRETIQELASVGVQTVDVSGTGGTDFIRIENSRRLLGNYDYLYGWGQSTVTSLVEGLSVPEEVRPQLLASGGIRTPLDVVKALALGADAVGIANRFLPYFQGHQDLDHTLYQIRGFVKEIQELMGLLGAKNIVQLRQKDMILGAEVQRWCEARRIDWIQYANRSRETV